jgi:hypothetical protein
LKKENSKKPNNTKRVEVVNGEKQETKQEQWTPGLPCRPKTRSPVSSRARPPPPASGLHRRSGRRWTGPSDRRWKKRRATPGASSCGGSRASPSSGPSTAATSGPSSAHRPPPRPPPSVPSAPVSTPLPRLLILASSSSSERSGFQAMLLCDAYVVLILACLDCGSDVVLA